MLIILVGYLAYSSIFGWILILLSFRSRLYYQVQFAIPLENTLQSDE